MLNSFRKLGRGQAMTPSASFKQRIEICAVSANKRPQLSA